MSAIKYVQLLKYLMKEEHFSEMEALRTISRVRRMHIEIRKAFFRWFNGYCPELTIEGVTFRELIEEENMRPVRAFLFMDWLRREPGIALTALVSLRHQDALPPLNKENAQKLEELSKNVSVSADFPQLESDHLENKDDIDVD